MNKLSAIAVIVLVAFAWTIGTRLSDDAVSMAVGYVLGALSGIPVALIVVAAGRRKEQPDRAYPMQNPQPYPPVVMFSGQHNQQAFTDQQYQQQPLLPVATNHSKAEIEYADW